AGVERLRELTGGLGAHSVLECVGHGASMQTAIGIARPGGAVGRVGVPQEATMPASQPVFYGNITVGGGPAPVRAYIEELLPDILEGRIEPGKVLDRTVGLDGVPEGYRAMADRESIKVMVRPCRRRTGPPTNSTGSPRPRSWRSPSNGAAARSAGRCRSGSFASVTTFRSWRGASGGWYR